MKLCIDLCSGLEGFSQAFKLDSSYEVITIDIDKSFKPTICADVRFLPLKESLAPEVLLASPPCNHFTLACLQFPRNGVMLAFQLVGACFEAVAFLKPKKWIIENPRGRLRGFIGEPNQSISYSDYDMEISMNKFTDFWGNFKLPLVKNSRRIVKTHSLDRIDRLHLLFPHGDSKLRAERAKVPFGVSQIIKEVIENIKSSKSINTLEEF